jgi:hypothetical protein
LQNNIENNKLKKYFKQTLDEQYSNYLKLKMNGSLMYNDTLTHYVQSIFNTIVAKNKIVFNKPIKLFLLRSDIPNAFNSGSETFILNLGLISNLNSESELAFIICHEIAHELKKHVFSNIHHVGIIQSSRSYKKELRISKQQKYNSYNLSKDFYYTIKAKEIRNNINFELQADSFALELLKTCDYPQSGAIRALEILDSVDIKNINAKINYSAIFKSKQIFFDHNWLIDAETINLSSNLNFKIPDSLKTHPNCEYRINKLKLDSSFKKEILLSNNYTFYQNLAKFEEIETLMEEKKIDKALYKTIQLLNIYNNNIYLNATFYYCLYEIYEAKKNHTLSKIIPTADRLYPSNYNEFLTFINQVPNSFLKKYCEEFAEKVSVSKQNDYNSFVVYLIKSINLSQKEKENLSDDFAKLYINSRFSVLLEKKFKPKKP